MKHMMPKGFLWHTYTSALYLIDNNNPKGRKLTKHLFLIYYSLLGTEVNVYYVYNVRTVHTCILSSGRKKKYIDISKHDYAEI